MRATLTFWNIVACLAVFSADLNRFVTGNAIAVSGIVSITLSDIERENVPEDSFQLR